MAVYHNLQKNSALTAVEFTPVSSGNFAFFTVAAPERKEEAKAWLTSNAAQQGIIAETVVDGKVTLITHGEKSQHELINAIEARGDKLEFHHQPRGISELAWPVRSALGIAGQGLQLTSSLMRGKRDWGLFTFAVANLTANGINVLFGAQRTEDINRLRFLKTHINEALAPELAPGKTLPGVDEQRTDVRDIKKVKPFPFQPFNGFLRRHSVMISEIGLRYLGAISLVLPTAKWNKTFSELKIGNFRDAYNTGRDPSNLRRMAGIGSVIGKTTALFSKADDPYDPKPDSWLDTLREKFTFRLGGLMEMMAFSSLALDGFKGQKITWRGNQYRDYLSGTGAALFTLAYLARNWAPFGVKETNMDELYAHVSDSLANMPPEKLPQLMADTAAYIKGNFRDKRLDYGMVFTQIMTDLYRYHHITVGHGASVAKAETPAAEAETVSHLERLQKRQKPDLSLVVQR